MQTLSIIIPAYNEQSTIIDLLKKVNKVNLTQFNLKKEILFGMVIVNC